MPAAIIELALEALRPGTREALLAHDVVSVDDAGPHTRVRPTSLTPFVIDAAVRRVGLTAAPAGYTRDLADEDAAFLRELFEKVPRRETDSARPNASLLRIAEQASQNERELNELVKGYRCFKALMRSRRPMSVEEIARHPEVRLTPETVEKAASALIEQGFIRTASESRSFELDDSEHCVLGINISRDLGSVTKLDQLEDDYQGVLIGGVITNLRADVQHYERVRVGTLDPKSITEEIVKVIFALLGIAESLGYRNVIGTGVELGGHIASGEVILSPNLGWSNVSLGENLYAQTGIFTVVENDVNAIAIFEDWFGQALDRNPIVVIAVRDGIGGGLVVDKKLVHGANGIAGEIGHVIVDPSGRPCRCGGRGCLESVASTSAMLSIVREVTGMDLTLGAATALADSEEGAEAATVFTRAGEFLGRVVAMLLNVINPAYVLLTGPAELMEAETRCGQAYRRTVLETCQAGAFPTALDNAKILWTKLSDETGATGAAAAVLQELAKEPLVWPEVPLDGQQLSRIGIPE
ncbi:MAG: ROK family protein [Acidimicrobiales bacterium]